MATLDPVTGLPTVPNPIEQPKAVPDAVANPYTATTGNASNWTVDNNSTVQGRLNGLLSAGSDYIKLAETGAKQQANASGLLNTSMAVGAGRAAAIGAAMPIAQQDASTFANAGQFNAGQNQNMTLANMNATNTASQYNSGLLSDTSKFNVTNTQQASLAQMGINADWAKANLTADTQTNLANMDIQSKQWLQQTTLDANKMLAEMGISADKDKAFQAQQATALDTYARAVAAINSNKDTTTEQKNAGIENARQIYKTGVQVAARLAAVQLDPNLWGAAPADATTPPATPPPATTPPPAATTTPQTVADLYRQVLGREPDASGLASWTAKYGNTIEPAELAAFKSAASTKAELAKSGYKPTV